MDMKLLIATSLLTLLAFAAGTLLGAGIQNRLTNDKILTKAAELKNQQDEIERITLGLKDGLIDASGHRTKLIAPSVLRRASTEQLEQIAQQRGLLTMQNLGEKETLIDAITEFQRRLTGNRLTVARRSDRRDPITLGGDD